MKDYSVVIPVYNSSSTLEELCQRLHATLQSQYDFEIVLVDDGSRDKSWDKLTELKKKYPSTLSIVRLSKNFGQHNAISCGFSVAKGKLIITMDDDLQHPPEETPRLIEKQKECGADVVYGIPRNRKHSFFRTAGSYFVRKSSRYLQGNKEGSSFRILKKDIADSIASHQHKSMIYIDEIITWYTSFIDTVDVDHHERKSGRSGYTTGKLLKLYFDIVINHSAVPLKIMTWAGVVVSVITALLGVYFIIRKFMFDVPIGFTALIVTILFTASLLMMCMGIIGQYLYKLHLLQNRKPGFHIREQH